MHVCIYKKGNYAVDENFERHTTNVKVLTKNNSINKIRLNHYHCKSKEDYLNKINKGFADHLSKRKYCDELLNFKNTTNDYVAWKYLN